MKKTVLHDDHVALGARMVDFAGYAMPVQYQGVIAEHQCVRERVGIFDVSHMGWLSASGNDAPSALNPLFTKDLSKLKPGSALYSLMCQVDGGTIDDLILYKESDSTIHMVLNASNKEKDLIHMQRYLGKTLRLEPHFDDVSIFAIQGPRTLELLRDMGCQAEYAFMSFHKWRVRDADTWLAFTGYTGEVGAEWIVPNHVARDFWKWLLEAGQKYGIAPCGLAARDTLRTEMGYSLYGHELSDEISPVEAGLNWAISWDKADFVGKGALLAQKAAPKRKLLSLKSASKRAARPGSPVHDSTGRECGQVTSGTFSPSLGHSIALALVNADSDGPYYVPFREDKVLFEITKRPFYTKKT